MGQSKSRKKMQINKNKNKNACIYKNYEIVKYP